MPASPSREPQVSLCEPQKIPASTLKCTRMRACVRACVPLTIGPSLHPLLPSIFTLLFSSLYISPHTCNGLHVLTSHSFVKSICRYWATIKRGWFNLDNFIRNIAFIAHNLQTQFIFSFLTRARGP